MSYPAYQQPYPVAAPQSGARRAFGWAAANVSTLILSAVLLLFLFAIVGWVRDCEGKKQTDLLVANMNMAARLDSLRHERDTALRLAFVGDSLGEIESESARELREEAGRELAAATRIRASVDARLSGIGRAPRPVEDDSTSTVLEADVATADSFAFARVETTLHRHVVPPDVETTVEVDVSIPELEIGLTIERDPETCAPTARVWTPHPQVGVVDLQSSVSREDWPCLDDSSPWPMRFYAAGMTLTTLLLLLGQATGN